MLDYIRIACGVNPVQVAGVKNNVDAICSQIAKADEKNCDLLVFPELSVTGYTCADLFFQDTLIKAAAQGLKRIVSFTQDYPALTVVVGLPVKVENQLYNCGAVIRAGVLKGLVPKTYIPNYGEFCEKRWFASGYDLTVDYVKELDAPIGADQVFALGDGTTFAVEVCEDLWSAVPPSSKLSLAGAEVIVNLAASTATAGKRESCRKMVTEQSRAAMCAYVFCSAGADESTADMVFSGQSIIAQNGRVLAENQEPIATEYLLVTDADLAFIRHERSRKNTFRDTACVEAEEVYCDDAALYETSLRSDGSLMHINKLPFIPETAQARQERCREVFAIQVAGLKRRLKTIGAKAVVGISGGLDSTLALLVAVEAMRQLGRPLTDVHGITMPCFGTSDRTYQNAWELMRTLGISASEISIKDAVSQHFTDIGQDPSCHDTTYENAQARERTQILMDYAGRIGGIVIGTGDLSELALGWCTYNGDHMSMYSVNGSVPKTLIRWVIATMAETPEFAASAAVLRDILDTPISPELLPPDAEGKISQQTEDIVGPYALHDFFLYHMVRCGFAPERIYTMACRAFKDDFDGATVKKWLVNFYRRFFTQQFKRNCMPDGAKVGSISFSPRGDWNMPSDAVAKLWLEETEAL